ncbi:MULTISPECIES: TIM-barrel domain-containing protein [unclassified Marinitoga]|uniref:TIM-barrel domain-containing protein n=1 Tax=unclassified Marinitoga TaxID=2640159 RepID=UPI000640EEE9|nr:MULTISPECIES: TIM-barrel domain-containing protein [unclassified Marinitoga]KLO23721.1 alpha-glucosidase [Marinitoga sp. 1155]NUV00123.1 alpha-glucosidase [Marinitoga sp. 1154]
MKKAKLLNFTTLYRFGNPFETEAAIVEKNNLNFEESKNLDFFELEENENQTILKLNLEDSDRIYGLGQTLGGLNKRGKLYRLYATDDPIHTPEKESLYGSHPFVIIDEKFGFFIDYPSEIIFDIGYNKFDLMEITINSKDFDLYIFNSNNNLEVIQEYLRLTGEPYIPPKWAFGYQQCRWSYPNAETIKEVAENFRKKEIPCDAIYMDIDYMKNYKVFTIDEEKFPNFPNFVKEMNANGFKLIPIIDPGVKIEEDYNIYEEGIKNEYFCKDINGNYFVATVWPGHTHFPDFLNPDVRKWWGEKYKIFTDLGITGFWNDMNEPSIFFVPKSLKNYLKKINKMLNKEIGLEFFIIKDEVNKLSNNREYYKSFYHETPQGNYSNEKLHNLYGYYMTKATVEGFEKLIPNKRYLLLSRSSYAGHHRIATIWMGDNMSWWEHMLVNIRMLISLNMAGFFYTGADIGGFGSNSSPELVIRWMQLGIFSPLYRNHSALGTRNQEPWAFDGKIEEILKNIIRLRYGLIPYLYSEFFNSIENLKPFISPLFLYFNDELSKDIEDQFMVGNSLMAAPVIQPNAKGRFVYLPEKKWLYWKASKLNERKIKIFKPGTHYVEAKLNEIPIFIKENSLIILNEDSVNYVNEKAIKELTVIGLVTDKAEFTYFEDDGETYDFKNGKYAKIKLLVIKNEEDFDFEVEKDENENYNLTIEKIRFEIYDGNGEKFIYTLKI